jgi:hypothetical protein
MSRNFSGRIGLALACSGGLVVGFAFGMVSGTRESTYSVVPVAKELQFNRSSSDSAFMDKGWGAREVWGAWMGSPVATLMLGFDGPAGGDVELLIEGRVRPGAVNLNGVIVRYNDAELGRWRLPPNSEQLRRRFVVPEAVFNRSTLGTLTFESIGAPNAGFGLEGVSLRDVRRQGDFKGFVDRCSSDRLVGWAVGENIPIAVAATVDGAPLPAVFNNVNRPDLKSNGFPPDAGFEILPSKPIAAGSTVEVRFPNGRHLNGSPCQL